MGYGYLRELCTSAKITTKWRQVILLRILCESSCGRQYASDWCIIRSSNWDSVHYQQAWQN